MIFTDEEGKDFTYTFTRAIPSLLSEVDPEVREKVLQAFNEANPARPELTTLMEYNRAYVDGEMERRVVLLDVNMDRSFKIQKMLLDGDEVALGALRQYERISDNGYTAYLSIDLHAPQDLKIVQYSRRNSR